MAKLTTWGSHQIQIRNKAVELTRGLSQKDYPAEARALLEFVRDRVRYVRDIAGVETLHDPVTLLDTLAGDCDDKAILLGALLMSIGHRVAFVANAYRPNQYAHVWVRVSIYGQWIDLEPTEPLPYGERVPVRGQVSEMVEFV